jgi:hypothetical protein
LTLSEQGSDLHLDLSIEILAGKATDDPSRTAWHIPPLLSTKEIREGHEKR